MWRAGAASVKRLASQAADFVYPPYCLSCRGEVAAEADLRIYVCMACRESLSPPAAACPRCGAPVGPHLAHQSRCGICRSERFAFERTYALAAYENDLRRLLLQAKSAQGRLTAVALARLLFAQQGADIRQWSADCVVAVPTDWRTRLWERHRASDSLAEETARLLNLPLASRALRKTRRTPRQTDVTPTERRTNLRGAFAVRQAGSVVQRRILLVDDVMTTGATAHESAVALRAAGATAVAVAVIGRSVGTPRAVPKQRSRTVRGDDF